MCEKGMCWFASMRKYANDLVSASTFMLMRREVPGQYALLKHSFAYFLPEIASGAFSKTERKYIIARLPSTIPFGAHAMKVQQTKNKAIFIYNQKLFARKGADALSSLLLALNSVAFQVRNIKKVHGSVA